MRTTVEFDEDTTAAIEQVRREVGVGVSEAVNQLIRRGLLVRTDRPPFVQATCRLGLKMDVSNVADALEILDGPRAR
ncbi:MAG: CopG family transcriptional regulator [Actinomycetota bacterium]|jgi:hypothetical protein|nr:MAG: hypothetical protein FD127_1360 [Acidimicrobiaceae bacterium]